LGNKVAAADTNVNHLKRRDFVGQALGFSLAGCGISENFPPFWTNSPGNFALADEKP
jgi:hypothetical protein